jgi:type VI secretion system protein ImpL
VYVPRDATFRNWQGQKGAMADAFGGGDPEGLAAYLERQQEFIDTIVGQADGVLNELSASRLREEPLVVRWRALAADLRRYRLKSPTSSRMALEAFIAAGSADIDIANCVDKLAMRRPARQGADVFAERLQSLQSGMLARCRELASGDDQRQWQRFAEAYNRDLGRRAPFVMPASGTTGSTSGDGVDPDAVPADRDAVGAVMKLYDRARAASALVARDPGQPAPRPEVRRADQQLRRVRDLLAPLYPAEEGQVGGLDVAVEFRANTVAEAGAGNIIDWSLTVGAATLRLGEPARSLRWEPGMPVLLSLRLARDGALVPKVEPGRPGMRVAERTVSFRFDDPWALLSFVNAYRDGDTPGDDGRTSLLRFEVPLAGAAAPAPDARARVFVRLRVSPPGKHLALAWPAVFPAQVPPWQDPQKASL